MVTMWGWLSAEAAWPPDEALAFSLGRELSAEQLDGDEPAEACRAAVDHAHAAFAEPLEDFVVRDHHGDHRRRSG